MSLSICTILGSGTMLGGAEVQLRNIQRELINKGHKVFHININYNGTSVKKYSKSNNFKAYNIDINTNNPFWEVLSFIKIVHLFKTRLRNKVDVFYTRGYYFLLPLVFIKKSFGIPVITTAIGKNSCQTNFQNLFVTKTFKFSHLLSKVFLSMQLREIELLCLTADQSKSIQKNFGINAPLIRNGHPVSTSQRSHRKIITWIGNMRPVKRVNIFLDIVQNLKDLNCIFVLIGKNTDKRNGILINKLSKNAGNFFYVGQQDNNFCNRLLAKTSLLVNTSKSEGFSNTFIQAWLRGTPTATLGINPDGLITENKLGFVCNNRNNLLQSIRNFIVNPSKDNFSRKEIKDFADNNFSISKTVNHLLIKIRESINEH